MQAQTSPINLSSLQLKSTTLKYKHFIVRYFIRYDNGNLVYQFYTEDPELLEAAEMAGRQHDHIQFPVKFKDVLTVIFKSKINQAERLDIAYIGIYNSYSVIARGYAESPGLQMLLDPLFEELNEKLA
jgi:hypothetical protein